MNRVRMNLVRMNLEAYDRGRLTWVLYKISPFSFFVGQCLLPAQPTPTAYSHATSEHYHHKGLTQKRAGTRTSNGYVTVQAYLPSAKYPVTQAHIDVVFSDQLDKTEDSILNEAPKGRQGIQGIQEESEKRLSANRERSRNRVDFKQQVRSKGPRRREACRVVGTRGWNKDMSPEPFLCVACVVHRYLPPPLRFVRRSLNPVVGYPAWSGVCSSGLRRRLLPSSIGP